VSLRLGPPLSSGAACAAAAFDGSPRDHYFPRLIDHKEVHRMSASDTLERHFSNIGARARVVSSPAGRVALDVRTDGRGEHFVIGLPNAAEALVLEARRRERHLVVLVKQGEDKSRFLCGHDERHWFVAAIPESALGTTVAQALQALRPEAVQRAAAGLRPRQRARRRNPAFVRQGEWFFVPTPELRPDPAFVLRDEPLSRGRGSRPHIMERACRRGGALVNVSRSRPAGLTQEEFEALPELERRSGWRSMRRDAEVFANGRVRHPDHATVMLRGWHRVFMNTEAGARAMQHVVFLD
jgi:hypothetical protein